MEMIQTTSRDGAICVHRMFVAPADATAGDLVMSAALVMAFVPPRFLLYRFSVGVCFDVEDRGVFAVRPSGALRDLVVLPHVPGDMLVARTLAFLRREMLPATFCTVNNRGSTRQGRHAETGHAGE
jgi:hypothetical protein